MLVFYTFVGSWVISDFKMCMDYFLLLGKQSCENCSPECKKLVGRKRIRKEVNRLTPDEKSVLNNAMKEAMKPHPDNGFSI